MLTMADKGGRVLEKCSEWLTKGGGGVWTPSFLADLFFEQPLTCVRFGSLWFTWAHLGSLGFTWVPVGSLGFTLVYFGSLLFIWVHLDSLGFT